ncbi:MAG TPA: adenylate/guanylate cyclase domain-containing protein [Bradyrhizobium sp.]|nr:adenylate/guanylate cyclase domain-containing protein [Bradyrhizobium sp.]
MIERVERRLAAVLAADVAGYSRLMGADEEGTLGRLKAVRKALVDPTIAAYRGRIVKTTGDGMLVEFASAVDATRCAIEVQRGIAAQNADVPQDVRIEFRVGIHVGDIIVDEDDIFGDGVNIAARLEGIAEPGGVCMSDDTYRQVRGKVEIACDDLGLQTLKNIAEPMRAWRVQLDCHSIAKAQLGSPAGQAPALALPSKPSIAVLPFQNMSGDPEQEYFADGMVEDIITALSRFKSLFVIARNSSFTYKGKAVDIKQVGRELGVRYVLQGSVRKSTGRVRITGQLIESATGAHIWADRFDGKLEDVFELQDRITTSVVGGLMTHVQRAEIERANRKSTSNLDAYDCYWRGLAQHVKYTKSGTDAALAYFRSAIELDETFASAYAVAGVVYAVRKQNLWMANVAQETAEAIRFARYGMELDQMDEAVLCRSGFVLAYFAGELDLGAACTRRALAINPNFDHGWQNSAWVQIYLGNHQTALEHIRQYERLSPRDPSLTQSKLQSAHVHLFQGHYEEAAHLAEQISSERPTFAAGWRVLAVSKALGGDVASAHVATKRALEINPSQTASALASLMPLRRSVDVERLKEGYLRAGFPA